MKKNEQQYVNAEIENSTKLLGLIDIMKAYTEALYLNRLEHVRFCKENYLKDSDMDNFDIKRFNQTVKNKTNKINNGLARADKYYKILIKDFNYNTEVDPILHDALIDKFDLFCKEHIKVKGNTLTIE